MAQRNIDFGSFPDDPSADAIRTAFQKVQENFTEVFAGLADQAVASVNKTPGPGIYLVNGSPVGNVVLGANIACVQVETSTLGIGIGTGNNSATYASYTSSSQILTVDLPSSIANVSNITIDGTLTANYVNANIALTSSNNLFVTANANVGNLNSNNATITSNLSAGNINAAGSLVVSTNANVTGTLGVQGAATVGSLSTSGTIGATGDISGANLHANLAITATGNILGQNILSNANVIANGNVVAGNVYANSGTIGASLLTGTLITNGQPNITSVGTLTSLDVTGNITGGNANLGNAVTANYFIGSGANLSNINGANVTGSIGNANFASYAGNVTDSAQPNITSLGTLTSLDVTGNLTSGNANLGNLAIANFVTGTLTTNAQPNVTSVGTLTSLAVTGNVTAGNVYANAGLIQGSLLTGSLTTNSQPNVTSVGTLTSLNVSGNITASNVTANTGVFTGNGAGLTNLAGANVTGTVANATYSVSAGTANTVTDAAQPNITSVGTLTGLTVGGHITPNANITYDLGNNTNRFRDIYLANSTIYLGAATLQANSSALILTNPQGGQLIVTGSNTANGASIVNGNSNVVVDANSNVTVSVAGTSNVLTVTSTGANITGTANITGNANVGNLGATGVVATTLGGTLTTATQPNITSVGTLTSLAVTGNVTAGNVSAGNIVTANYVSGTLTTAAQPNVTSVGTLTGLDVSGNANFTGANIYISNIANFRIPGGTSGYTIKTDGAGNLAWGADTAAAAGSNTDVQFNDAGSIGGSSGLTFNKTSNLLTVGGGLTVNNTSATVNFTNSANVTLGAVANLHISGGGSNTVLTTNGSGGLSFTAFAGTPPGGPNGAVQYNSSTVYTGEAAFAYNDSTNTLTVDNITLVGSGSLTGGNLVSANLITGTLTTASQPNITTIGTLGNLIVTGNINAGNISGNGFGLSSSNGANVSGQVANALVAGTVYTAAQPNITSVGTLSSLSISGNVSAGNANLGNAVIANYFTGNFYGTANNATLAAHVTDNSQPNITSVGTLTSLIVNGNINAGNIAGGNLVSANYVSAVNNIVSSTLTSNVSTGTAPLTVTSTTRVANLNVSYSNVSDFTGITSVSTGTYYLMMGNVVTGNVALSGNTAFSANAANGSITATTFVGALSGAATSATTAGTVTSASQPNITSVGTLTGLGVNGTITGVNITANTGVFTGNANGLTSIPGANVTGTVPSATSATSATTAGTVTTAAQPNITSVGTLTGLTSSGNISGANVISTAYNIRSVGTGISAAGSTQGTATSIAKEINVVSTVSSGQGVVLPTAVAGMVIIITNTSANSLLVYPASGGAINSLATNAGYTQQAGGTIQFIAPTSTQWYTVGATYA